EIEDPLRALEAAAGACILVESPDRAEQRITFRHALVRAAVYYDIGSARRAALHARAARIVADDQAPVRHRLAAAFSPDAALARDAAAVGRQHAGAARWAAAGSTLAAAGYLTPDRQARNSRVLDAVDCMFNAGELERAARLGGSGAVADPTLCRYV